jgi:hypothetical protein
MAMDESKYLKQHTDHRPRNLTSFPTKGDKMPARFDFALSFAGAQRSIAERIRNAVVDRLGLSVFYDRDYEHEMIGTNGAEYLRNIYSRESRFCLVLISPEYDQSQWTALERESIEGREIRGEKGVLLPIRVVDHSPAWLPETRIYFDLVSRNIDDLVGILSRLVSKTRMSLSTVATQDDLHGAISGTTWRKATGLEHLVFQNGGRFYNNHAGHTTWRENYYRIDDDFRSITLTWSVDGLVVKCRFNDDFSAFKENELDDCTWVLVAKEPHIPPWGI